MYARELQELGLTEGEAKVYLALVKHGSVTVGPIVKESKVAYSNVYEILERLKEKGLVSFIVKSKTHYYQAVPAHRIKDYLAKKREELAQQERKLHALLPALEQYAALSDTSAEAEVFVGWKALRSAYERLIEGAKPGDEELYFYSHDEKYNEKVDQFFVSIQDLLRDAKMTVRGISQEQYKKYLSYEQQSDYMTLRFVDFPIPTGIDIVNDKVLISAWGTPVSVLITSQEIADGFRTVFEDMWAKGRT